jgi:hypothetical protein
MASSSLNPMAYRPAKAKGFVTGNSMNLFQKKLRAFVAEFPQDAARCIQRAADETLVPILKDAMTNEKKTLGRYSHVFQDRLRSSISAKVIPNPKAPSIMVGFDMEVPHVMNFLKGGLHGDWSIGSIQEWVTVKDKIKNRWNAFQRAKRIVEKVLDKRGSIPYHDIIMAPFSQLVRTGKAPSSFAGIASGYPKFHEVYKAYLYDTLERFNLNNTTTDSGVPF